MHKSKAVLNLLIHLCRELDRGTMYLRNHLNQTDLKGFAIDKDNIDVNLVSKILFKSIVYRLINKVETFMDFGGVPDIESFPKFLKFLREKRNEGSVIFTAAHQNMGFDRLMRTFDFVKKNLKNLTSKLVSAAEKRYVFLLIFISAILLLSLMSKMVNQSLPRYFCATQISHLKV